MVSDKDSNMEQNPYYSSLRCHINLRKKKRRKEKGISHTLWITVKLDVMDFTL